MHIRLNLCREFLAAASPCCLLPVCLISPHFSLVMNFPLTRGRLLLRKLFMPHLNRQHPPEHFLVIAATIQMIGKQLA